MVFIPRPTRWSYGILCQENVQAVLTVAAGFKQQQFLSLHIFYSI